MAKKQQVELISVAVKVDGKRKVFKKEAVSFHGWEAECDTCGSHGGTEMTIYDEKGKRTFKVELESY